ncbi:hypothetical protein NQ314_019901 [Rhamnusium bicolor]|uniref:Alpha-macroglobulin receptor-binding domain-containing protein n=1 Tax=Rhamnusium bicolor TaxID=1586634 RepID=A0AAV8WM54_9CUCU|nr:hypothetical protein NQ314_019901 [Rhamnusium bicolor]
MGFGKRYTTFSLNLYKHFQSITLILFREAYHQQLSLINYKVTNLSGALASLSPLLTLQHLGRKANETERLQVLQTLPGSTLSKKQKIFLENSLPNVESPETIAAVTLALVLVRSATAAWAIEKLRNASTTEDGEFGWPHFMPPTVDEYKASLHALTTFCIIGDLKSAESVARFLFYRSHMLDKHEELLYPAVKAFSQYDTLARDRHRSLTISLATSGMELTDTLELKSGKRPQVLYLPSLPTKVFVYATGAGCATIQGKTTFSTYSANSKTQLLDLWSGVTDEILPDRSSVEEIEGKLPMLKLKTCFKWKGNKPSAVLRLEITLFSGFELTTTPPQLLNPPQEMAEMQHSFHANKLWFIFANVSTACPICVQFIARSAFVITSLRPAYAKIYPASREDLAAETFFHAQFKSNLLKSVTADDMITWFGANATINDDILDIPTECKPKEVSTTDNTWSEESATLSPATFSPENLQKLNAISVASYTINFDNGSIVNLTDENISKPSISSEPATTTTESLSLSSSMHPSTTNFPKFITGSSEKMIQDNIIPDDDGVVKFINPTTFAYNPINDGDQTQTENDVEDITENDIGARETTELPNLKNLEDNTSNISAAYSVGNFEMSTPGRIIDDKLQSPIKHINIEEVHDIPVKYGKPQKETEEPITFAPEIKNDQYILLDKEALWGMLREVVDDEFKKKRNSKIIDGQKLRSQGFT